MGKNGEWVGRKQDSTLIDIEMVDVRLSVSMHLSRIGLCVVSSGFLMLHARGMHCNRGKYLGNNREIGGNDTFGGINELCCCGERVNV